MEEWRDIKGYEGLYQVSSWGRVKSLNYKRTGKEGILNGDPNNIGYMSVVLYKNGKRKPRLIHRLVAAAFIPNPDNLPIINHIDENKNNNRVDNLEWCTHEYNTNYGTANKRRAEKSSKTLKGRKLTNEHKNKISESNKGKRSMKVKCITTGEIFKSITEASEKYNIVRQNISSCCKGKYKSAGKHPITGEKLIWEFIE